VIKRIILLAIVVLLPVALLALWPKVRRQFTAARLIISVVRQPREEVMLSGAVNGFEAKPFSIQTLRIEEPGKEAYRRLVSLDAENKLELALGQPTPGTYRASILLGHAESAAAKSEKWLKTPPLTLDTGRASPTGAVEAIEYDRSRLFVVAGACVAVWAGLLVVCLRTWNAGVHRLQ
jgi:hypothetical protein